MPQYKATATSDELDGLGAPCGRVQRIRRCSNQLAPPVSPAPDAMQLAVAVRAERHAALAEIIATLLTAMSDAIRGVIVRWTQIRSERATYRALRALDTRTLHDLGLDASETAIGGGGDRRRVRSAPACTRCARSSSWHLILPTSHLHPERKEQHHGSSCRSRRRIDAVADLPIAASDERARDRYAKTIEVSKRIRWDIDRDVIRGRAFDFGKKFLPDGLSKLNELAFITPAEHRFLSQIQGRTYANIFGLVERFIGAKVLEISKEHWLGDQVALEALVRFTDEELKHQEMFRRLDAWRPRACPPATVHATAQRRGERRCWASRPGRCSA